MKITAAESEEVVRCFLRGESLNSLTARFRRGHRTICAVLRADGIDPVADQPLSQRARLRYFQIICRYRGGELQVDLAREFGISQPAVHYIIRDHSASYDLAFGPEVRDAL